MLIGFDFGTTNSLMSVGVGDRVIHFLDDEGRPIPSVVAYEGTDTVVGREARELLDTAGLGVHQNVVRSPKTLLGKSGVFVDGVLRDPVNIVAEVVRFVHEHALHVSESRREGVQIQNVSGAVVTIPVDMSGERRRLLREAFHRAGLRIWQFVHEPLAALYGYFRSADFEDEVARYDGKIVLVFDWGGGTLDLTLCRIENRRIVQIMNDGTGEVGGDEVDQVIMDALVQRVCEERNIHQDVHCHHGARARLLDKCERAKIALSQRETAAIYAPDYFDGLEDEDFDCSLRREELDQIVSPILKRGFRRIQKLLDDAGYQQEQIALCLATGGMVNMPGVQQRLHELFGPARVRIPDGTATMIAEGAAWIAEDRSQLELAKNVEVSLARNSFLPLVKAGSRMPTAGEVNRDTFHLYCVDPRDGFAKFEVVTPQRTGSNPRPSDDRDHLAMLTVAVDPKAKPFRERLELDVSIDHDLVLTADARSVMERARDTQEVYNLEFALSLYGSGDRPSGKIPGGTLRHGASETSAGLLRLRSNIASEREDRLVPGDLMYSYNPHYFHNAGPRLEMSEEQDHERLYFEPCSRCRRDINDPACLCA